MDNPLYYKTNEATLPGVQLDKYQSLLYRCSYSGAQAEGNCRRSVPRFHRYYTAFQARSRTSSGALDTLRHVARPPHASLLNPGFTPWEWGSTRSIRGTSLGSCGIPRLFTVTAGRREMTICVTARGPVEGMQAVRRGVRPVYLWVPMVAVRSWCCGGMSVYECV